MAAGHGDLDHAGAGFADDFHLSQLLLHLLHALLHLLGLFHQVTHSTFTKHRSSLVLKSGIQRRAVGLFCPGYGGSQKIFQPGLGSRHGI
ncbi:hypothetical protein D3C71_1776890 [compost metagenome]